MKEIIKILGEKIMAGNYSLDQDESYSLADYLTAIIVEALDDHCADQPNRPSMTDYYQVDESDVYDYIANILKK